MKARAIDPSIRRQCVLGLCLLAGCGDSQSGVDANIADGNSSRADAARVDAGRVIDAAQCPGFEDYSTADGCATGACGVLESHGDLDCVDGNAWTENGETVETWTAPIPAPCSGPTNRVQIGFWRGRSVFADGVEPKTIELAGEELDPSTCGACVQLDADWEAGRKCYFATGGTLTLTSVAERVTGTLEDVTFQHVVCDGFAPPIDDGCGTSIERLWFDDEVADVVH